MLTFPSVTSQIRQGIANNTKGTAFVVYEDVMDAKQACDKLNGFNFQNRYLVGTLESVMLLVRRCCSALTLFGAMTASNNSLQGHADLFADMMVNFTVLYHQPEKMARSKENLAERQENLEKLKKQHGID